MRVTFNGEVLGPAGGLVGALNEEVEAAAAACGGAGTAVGVEGVVAPFGLGFYCSLSSEMRNGL